MSKGPEPGRGRLADVERAAIRRQADAVGIVEREDHLPARTAVGLGVEDAGNAAAALRGLAVIGEPEAAGIVEDEVVRSLERHVARRGIEFLESAGGEIDALDRPAAIVVGGAVRQAHPVPVAPPEAAIVAEIEQPVGTKARPFGPPPVSTTHSFRPSGGRG
jgi:hypothetical protein